MTARPGVRRGPLDGVRIVELAGIGPGPFACSYLTDLGADVVRIERKGAKNGLPDALADIGRRHRPTLALDLKNKVDCGVVMTMISHADVLIEGFRPGVTERLGIGPEPMFELNPRLVYVRLTGWGQDGPLAQLAGHDINYISLNGTLAAIGAEDQPVPPLNLVGDYGGGAMFAIIAVLAALLDRDATGVGQVIDVAMVDGSAALMGPTRDLVNAGLWNEDRSSNLLDGGAPFYRTYRTSDGEFMAVGALEPQFYSALLVGLGLVESELLDRHERQNWNSLTDQFSDVFAGRSRDEWTFIFNASDACVTPVLRLSEVESHPHNRLRSALRDTKHGPVPSMAPRFSDASRAFAGSLDGSERLSEVLSELGLDKELIRELESGGVASWS